MRVTCIIVNCTVHSHPLPLDASETPRSMRFTRQSPEWHEQELATLSGSSLLAARLGHKSHEPAVECCDGPIPSLGLGSLPSPRLYCRRCRGLGFVDSLSDRLQIHFRPVPAQATHKGTRPQSIVTSHSR